MGSSIRKNILYNLLYQIVTTVLPLITVPYISRVLEADGIGIYSYTLSITQYFILFGTLGLSMYGNRQIAYTRDDKKKLSKTFWSIWVLRLLTISLSAVLYIYFVSKVKQYKEIYLVQSINIVAAIIDISWLYVGLEDFKKTVTRNIFVKIIGVCFIFALVRTKNDLISYVMINVFMVLLGNASMWLYLPNIISKVKLDRSDIFCHMIPSIKLFIPQVAIQVYVVLDKTMLGLLSNVVEVGYYEQSEKVVKMVLSLVTILGTVMLPRISNLYANGEEAKIKDYLNISLRGVAYVALPLTFGVIGITREFAPWFFGAGFEPVRCIIPLLSPILFFIAMSNVIGVQYLLPTNRTREYTISVTFGAIVNLLLNVFLIPRFGAIGACIGTVCAEASVTLIQYKYISKEINTRYYLEGFRNYFFSGIVMLLFVKIIGYALNAKITTTIFQILVGSVVYVVVLTIIQEDYNVKLIKRIISTLIKKDVR